jgi:hypothetical protein
MVALASHSDTKKYWNWNDNFCGKRKRCIAVEASHQPKLRRLSVLSVKFESRLLQFWHSAGRWGTPPCGLTRLRQLLERKSFFPKRRRARSGSLSVRELSSPPPPHTHKTQKEEKKKTNKKISKSKKPCVHMWASACWCVCLVLSVNVYVFYTVLSIVSLCPTWSDAFSVGIRGQVCFSWNSSCSKSSLDSSVSLKNGCQS